MLREGMRGGDLEDLVLPMISVDEYESKINDQAIVFGFYVSDHDAAYDLNRFIQKSPANLLDTEVSPAPDTRGFYVVFLEVLDSKELPEVVSRVLDEVSDLVNIKDWQMQVRGEKDLVPFSEDALAKYVKRNGKKDDRTTVRTHKHHDHKRAVHENVLAFLRPSQLSGVRFEDDRLILEGVGVRYGFEVVGFGETHAMTEQFGLTGKPMNMSLTDIAREVRVSRMLGEGWNVISFGEIRVVLHEDGDDALLLRDR
jgi:hypothetical protein